MVVEILLCVSVTAVVLMVVIMKRLLCAAKKTIEKREKTIYKFESYYNMLNKWLDFKNEGRNIEEYFKSRGIKTIGVYGMGELGVHLCKELADTDVKVVFALDREINSKQVFVSIKNLNEDLPTIDAIVVTPVFAYDKIKSEIANKVNCEILSIEDIIYSM